jgi:hypothetical protein
MECALQFVTAHMSSPTVVSAESAARSRPTRIALVGFLLLSALYFADTLLRTTLKTFWFDELFTVYLCRLPSFAGTWHAVLRGVDFNPPLFYLMTRTAQHLGGGEGLIASRMPAILGFWLFGVCLYLFTAPRLGRLCGSIAALAPWFTLAHYYAYEARAHGPLLAWCGLMLVSWQRSRSITDTELGANRHRRLVWLLAFSLSFLGALLTHVYGIYLAVPFLLPELHALLRRRRPSSATLIALLVPALLVAPLYLEMAHRYKSAIPSGGLHIHPYEVVQQYLLAVFGPALILLLVTLALLAFAHVRKASSTTASQGLSFTTEELLVAIGLLLLPLLGVISVKVTHGPFFDRYFMDSTAGFALLLAQVTALSVNRILVVRTLLSAMLLLVCADALIALYCHLRHADIDLVEPSSRLHFSNDPAHPLRRRTALLHDSGAPAATGLSSDAPALAGLDVLITGHPDYLLVHYYAPPQLRSRLIFAAPSASEPFLIGYRLFSQTTGAGLRTTTLPGYFSSNPDFLLYQTNNGDCPDCEEEILRAGYILLSVDTDSDGRLEHFRR